VGMAPPSTSGPWSAAEFIHMLQIIPQNSLNQKGKELYSKLLSAIDTPNMDKKAAQGSVKFYPNFEIYQHKNTTDYKYDSDWIYDYDSRKPLLNIPIELYLTDYIYSESNFAFLKTRITKNQQAGNITDSSEIYSPSFNTNYPFGEDLVGQVDLNFPERAVIGIGFMNSALTLGRDDLNFSSGKTGSLTVGDHLDYYDFVRFNTFTDDFKFTYLVAGFDSPSWTSHSQNSTVDDNDTATTDDDNLKMYIAHRFEFRWLNNHLNFALNEAIIYQSSTIDFRYLNPALFYHNLFIRGNANSTLSAEVEITPIRHITIYGNVIVDEFPYPGEDQTKDGAHPNGIGQQYGIEATYLGGPGSLTAWFEYGNDIINLAIGLQFDWFKVLSASFTVMSMQHGENNIDTVWGMWPDNVNRITPYDDPATSETVEKSTLVSLALTTTPFAFSNKKGLEGLGFNTQLDFLKHQNKDNILDNDTTDIQWTIGISWEY